jgi:H+/Cl- antiporter ClcA
MWLLWFAVVSVSVRVLMKMTCTQDSCGFFGSGGFIIFEVSEGQENFLISELLPVILLGVVGGLLGSVFISLNARLVAWRREYLAPHGAKAKVAEALLISVLTSGEPTQGGTAWIFLFSTLAQQAAPGVLLLWMTAVLCLGGACPGLSFLLPLLFPCQVQGWSAVGVNCAVVG